MNGRYGVYVSTSIINVYNREVFFGPNSAVDSNGQGGLYVDTGAVNYLSATGGWFCGTTAGNGVTIVAGQPSNAMLKFVACRIYGNSQHGLTTADGQALIVASCEAIGNGTSTSTGGHGIYINGTTTGYVSITGNKVTNNGTGGAGWGIILSGVNPFFNVTDNECFGNTTGAISNTSGYGPNQIIANNPGATTANSMTNSLVMYNASNVNWDIDRTQNTYTLGAGATLNLPPGSGFVIVNNNNDGNAGAFVCGGGAAVLLGQSGSSFAAGVTSGKVSLSYNSSGACYMITNGTSGSVTLMLCTIKTRGAA